MKKISRYADHCKITTALLALLVGVSGPIAADEFHLANGNVIRGAIEAETPERFTVQTLQGSINISRADVVRHVTDGTTPLEVQGDLAESKGDKTAAVTAWQQALATAEEGSIAAARLEDKILRTSATVQMDRSNEILVLLNQARTMMANQQLDAAKAALDRLQVRNITDENIAAEIRQLEAQVHHARALSARDNVRLERARQEFEAAIAANPNFYPAYLDLGEMLLDNSSTAADGLQRLEQGLRIGAEQVAEPRRYELLYRMGQRYFDTGNYSQAAATFAMLIPARDQYPAYADALDRAVEAYVRTGEQNMTGDFQQTIATLNSALRLNPDNEKALFLLGRIYLDMGQLENSIITLERLAGINPGYPNVNLYLGRSYNQLQDYETALRYLSREIGLGGNNYLARLERAEAYINTGRFQEAEQDLATARALEPEGWAVSYLSGLLEFERNNYSAAQEELVQAVRRNRSAIPAMLLMGRVLDASNQAEGAREWLNRVVQRLEREQQLGPTYQRYLAEALTRLGEMAVAENSPRQAEEHLTRALQVDPSFPLALSTSGDALLLMSGDSFATSPEVLRSRAQQLYERAIQLEPNEAEHYLKLGRYYQQFAGNEQLARENYNLYVDKGGRDPEVNSLLAQAGGQPREEVNEAARAAAQAMPVQPGMTVTTTTAMMTTGTQLPAFPGAQPATAAGQMPTFTTTTIAGAVAPLPGMPAMPQVGASQTSGPEGLTSAVVQLEPITAIPTPGIMPPSQAMPMTTGTMQQQGQPGMQGMQGQIPQQGQPGMQQIP